MKAKRTAEAVNPSTDKLRKAGLKCSEALEAFERSKRVFASLIYESGYRDEKSFCAAMKEALTKYGGRVRVSDKTATFLYQEIINRLRR